MRMDEQFEFSRSFLVLRQFYQVKPELLPRIAIKKKPVDFDDELKIKLNQNYFLVCRKKAGRL